MSIKSIASVGLLAGVVGVSSVGYLPVESVEDVGGGSVYLVVRQDYQYEDDEIIAIISAWLTCQGEIT